MKALYWIVGILLFLSLMIIPGVMSRESHTLAQAMGNIGIVAMITLLLTFFAAGMSAGESTSDGIGPVIGATFLVGSASVWIASWLFGIGWIIYQLTKGV